MRSFECAKYEFRSKCVEPHTVPCPSQQPRQRCLAPFAPFERFAAQVVSVQLDQVERIQEHAAIVALIPDALEQRDAILAARDCLTIEDARAGASREGLDDEREALREVVPWAAVEPHALVLLPRDDLTPSCLISCSHWSPEGALGAAVGRQGAMKPDGKVRGRNDMSRGIFVITIRSLSKH
jgi:hypothetical protein